jgi:hypothetical protein
MKNILSKQLILIPVLYVVSKFLWDLLSVEFLPEILKGITSDLFGPPFLMTIVLWLFIYVLWKIPVFEKLTQYFFNTKPNIQGTWKGILKYEWDGKKTEKTVFLVIRQNDGYSLNIWLFTNERTSSSIFTDIVSYGGGHRIIYTYTNEEAPDNKEKNPSHEGFCQLDLVDNSSTLQGIYYTSRKTFGELRFDKRKRKLIMNFENAQMLFEKKPSYKSRSSER